MKRQVQKIETVCDFCNKENAWYSCLGCKKDVCYECLETKGIWYYHGCFSQGSGDGFYCAECNSINPGDALLEAYRTIRKLRAEYDSFLVEWDRRRGLAEEHLKTLQNGG